MSINETIITALEPTGLLTVPNEKQATTNRYLVFNYTSLGDDFGDDAPNHERYLIQIHLYCPPEENTTKLRNSIKKLLIDADFTFPAVVSDSDDAGQHWIFECEMAVEVYG